MPRVPLPWLAEHVELPAGLTAEKLAADLVRVGLEEEAIHPAAVTGPLVVGEVVERTPEPQKNGKTINWCRVDVGPEHNEPGGAPRGIVCGAHNFDVGDRVVVALPGAVLPGPFAIASRKTYGHVSDGMICSARELGLGEDHDGIIVLSTLGIDAPIGTDARELLGLGDEVLEINVTPDRGYCFSMRGVAREYSHSTGARFTDPALPVPTEPAPGGGFRVELDDTAPIHGTPGCDRFVAQVIRGVRADDPSPAWMQRRLQQAGMRPISLAVDVTNYVMLDLGQPLHAYDLTALAEPIVVRRAAPGERITTLDDVDRALDPEDLLITDSPDGARGSRPIGIAGVMGGASTEVGPATTDLLVEAAHFDPVTIARAARRHRLPSEASKRFERGVDPQLPRVAVARVVALLAEHGGGVAEPAITDVDLTGPAPAFELDLDLPGRLVGVPYTHDEVRDTLTTIGCELSDAGPGRVLVRPPSWRPDLTVGVDLVEEVARLRGYDAIPSVLPAAPAGRGLTEDQRTRRSVARALADAGLVEVLTYPFVGVDQLDALGVPDDDPRRRAVRLANPLAEQQPYLRTNLLVTLIDAARRNVARGNADLAVFEVGLVARPAADAPAAPRLPGGVRPSDADLEALDAAVPAQPRRVAGVLAGLREPAGWWGPGRRVDHTDAIEAALLVARTVGVDLVVTNDDHAPWHPGRCARLATADGTLVGHAGELHPNVVAAHDLPPRTAAFELDLDELLAAAPEGPVEATPVSSFPVAKEDVALVVPADVPAAEVLAAVRAGAAASEAGDVVEDVRLFDVYTGDQVGAGNRSLAFSLRLRAADRTLTAAETAAVRAAVVAEAGRRFGATLRA
ncbi:phenylalanine--tRNA ligase subunit beta [Cellulomonas alba]|uniref:Phenylalanine--tRNA ligase beta subunit n=1 Tax=Cellulomonas alba TaxID=3053467 RepID=A0ABT7SJM2_9CELL|nr:phenylalanine--tRNA ligase subunit beta [Cellulomonas alba]MDM7856234.1 phenylalanine--tRNA ligase subunit beta [Cellulomonas alba]